MRDTRPRRTFAVISHPDAGKSTLTEALALHARVINEAGAVHGKGDRRATVSDWMAMEKARGISITSAALQFVYRDHVINLVDTPGHSDFSEDTYRVLSAVDSAVMLVDAGKGLEPQTLKLFKVCALRGIPVITVINKWDRPGLSALELMDLIQDKIKLRPTPLTWPVGEAGDFRGVLDRRTGEFVKYTRTAGGATRAPERRMGADAVEQADIDALAAAVEEHELLALDERGLDERGVPPHLPGLVPDEVGRGPVAPAASLDLPHPVERRDRGVVLLLDTADLDGRAGRVEPRRDRGVVILRGAALEETGGQGPLLEPGRQPRRGVLGRVVLSRAADEQAGSQRDRHERGEEPVHRASIPRRPPGPGATHAGESRAAHQARSSASASAGSIGPFSMRSSSRNR